MSGMEKLSGVALYATASIGITVLNKYVLTVWRFPSSNLLALAQFLLTCLILPLLRRADLIHFPPPSFPALINVFPLPLLFLGNTATSLLGTQLLSIPMFSVLRRLSILLTLLAERLFLATPLHPPVLLALAVIMLGSLIAAADDLAFSLPAYLVILLSDLFTALTGVVSKMKLNQSDGSALGTWGLMFYNSLCAFPLLLAFVCIAEPDQLLRARDFPHWRDWRFALLFAASGLMGTVLQYSIFFCTRVNSALTTSVTGCVKNVLTTYIGMLAPGMDYKYSLWNFVGVNVSMLGGLYYAKVEMGKKAERSAAVAGDPRLRGVSQSYNADRAGEDEKLLGGSSSSSEPRHRRTSNPKL